MSEKKPEVEPTKEWDGLYWAYNCPLQMWPSDDGWRVVNYMPRKETCCEMEEYVSEAELPQFCKNAAIRLRNLADLFDALGNREIEMIYYPDKSVEEARQSFRLR